MLCTPQHVICCVFGLAAWEVVGWTNAEECSEAGIALTVLHKRWRETAGRVHHEVNVSSSLSGQLIGWQLAYSLQGLCRARAANGLALVLEVQHLHCGSDVRSAPEMPCICMPRCGTEAVLSIICDVVCQANVGHCERLTWLCSLFSGHNHRGRGVTHNW